MSAGNRSLVNWMREVLDQKVSAGKKAGNRQPDFPVFAHDDLIRLRKEGCESGRGRGRGSNGHDDRHPAEEAADG
jgi:hypothetical protein